MSLYDEQLGVFDDVTRALAVAASRPSTNASECPSTRCTYYIPQVIARKAHFRSVIDSRASLPSVLLPLIGTHIAPLLTMGDGNCLLHALSLACWGEDRYSMLLKAQAALELITHLEWYKTTVSVDHFTEADWELAVTESTRPNSYLSLVHIFVMANVLQRPLLLYSSDERIETYGCSELAFAGLFLPLRHEPHECYKRPLVLCWAGSMHFVPVVSIEHQSVEYPMLDLCFAHHLQDPAAVIPHYVDWSTPITPPPIISFLDPWPKPILVRPFPTTAGMVKVTVRKGDDPYQVARLVQQSHGLPLDTIPTLHDRIVEETGLLPSTVIYPDLLPLVTPVRGINIPKPNEKHTAFAPPASLDGCVRMICKTSDENPHENQRLSAADKQHLEALSAHLSNEASSLTSEQLCVLHRLLTWPAASVWPVFDLVRTIVIHPVAGPAFVADSGLNFLSCVRSGFDDPKCSSRYTHMASLAVANLCSAPHATDFVRANLELLLEIQASGVRFITHAEARVQACWFSALSNVRLRVVELGSRLSKIDCLLIVVGILEAHHKKRLLMPSTIIESCLIEIGTLMFNDAAIQRIVASLTGFKALINAIEGPSDITRRELLQLLSIA